jgi:hypothetical protein
MWIRELGLQLAPNNLLQKATGLIGGCFPENQTRSTRARVRLFPPLVGRQRASSGGSAVVLCRLSLRDKLFSICQTRVLRFFYVYPLKTYRKTHLSSSEVPLTSRGLLRPSCARPFAGPRIASAGYLPSRLLHSTSPRLALPSCLLLVDCTT